MSIWKSLFLSKPLKIASKELNLNSYLLLRLLKHFENLWTCLKKKCPSNLFLKFDYKNKIMFVIKKIVTDIFHNVFHIRIFILYVSGMVNT